MTETTVLYNNKKLDNEVNIYLKEAAVEYLTLDQYEAITYKNFLKDKMLIVAAIRKGIPYSLFELIQKFTPFSESDWADFLGLSTKSMYRYKQSPDHLFKPIHTEKIIEMAEVTQLGLEVFESMDKFNLWLHTPNLALGKHKPIELLKDSYGKEMVMNELTLIDHGIFA